MVSPILPRNEKDCSSIGSEKEAIFRGVMEQIFHRHGRTLITMARASHELRQMLGQDTHTFAEQ